MKIQLLKNCLECGHHEWLRGKPRCKHPEMRLSEPNDDGLLFPQCPTDETKAFIDGCPLDDYVTEETIRDAIKALNDDLDLNRAPTLEGRYTTTE